MTITKDTIEERLYHVMDPEVDCDIMTMGLVREVTLRDDQSVHILHTLTTPLCPLGPQIQNDIRSELLSIGVVDVEIELTFDPPWEPPEELRSMLGI
jgi:metal-sulfur cluster biosynthetic enzyme